MSPSKIAIIGAGPGGLTLARLLQQNNVAFTVYEVEENRHGRNQGGTLDLHPRAGQAALREAGLIEEFNKHARPEADKDKVVSYNGHVFWDENQITEQLRSADDPGKPEIDRTKLRDILLDSIEPQQIEWNRKVVSVEGDAEPGKTNLKFADGTTESGIDLLVGADGAWSKARSYITDTKPFYSGVTMVELWSFNVTKDNPRLSKYIGAGSLFMFDEGRAIIAQRMGDDSIRVYAGVRQPETWKDDCRIDWSDHAGARKALFEQYFNDCSGDLKHAILETKDELIVRPLWMLPVKVGWEHKAGVTLIGDAAHLMTPFAGVGVNLAMTDALVLARELIDKRSGLLADASNSGDAIDAAVRAYEKFMFVHATENAEKTARGLEGHFSKTGGNVRSQKFLDHYEKITGKKLSEDHFDLLA